MRDKIGQLKLGISPFMLLSKLKNALNYEFKTPEHTRIPVVASDMAWVCQDGITLSYNQGTPTGITEKSLGQLSTLDRSWVRALLNCLCRSRALAQCLPGIGRSCTGGMLVKEMSASGKKLVWDTSYHTNLCHTNHALDELLGHLDKRGFEQIIHIGPNSKPEILHNVNL